ncbi:hypothetical protein CB0940_05042 [Cercospora beticola]|uniref:FR47-like domain-containing protein n=1 Tax=Cercospora beticola TaxID=122368 RepID=A0A2G5HL50_CERBT|nr:hypothetical protein CB0940_05042 [Cercospora beticola]PIA93245.1 hypothetical protein CB0940_05042 [Cercospora beticola]WPB02333.1 hypothetical protein RHO25_006967 [Cercospora beticola]
MPPPPPHPIHVHALTNAKDDSNVKSALKILEPHSPVSIPLHRRLQFGRFFEATTLLTSLACFEAGPGPGPEDEEWIMAFVDRSCRPETEVWMYGSWEGGGIGEHGVPSAHQQQQQQDALILSLIRSIKALGPAPKSIHQDILAKAAARASADKHTSSSDNDDLQDHSGVSRKDYTAHLLNPNLILFGATHSSTTQILTRNHVIKHVFDSGLVANWTFVFDIDDLPESATSLELPAGLHWGELEQQHFVLVRSRTQIPRQDRTLAVLPNVAIFESQIGKPIAWVFVGLDGSLTTLHVEEEWRGKGLAKMIAVKIWREKMEVFWEKEEPRSGQKEKARRLAHDYVISGNEASKKVSERLGGRHYADTFWIRVNLDSVSEA